MHINELQKEAFLNAERHGFHETAADIDPTTKLFLMNEELVEAFQEIRDGKDLNAIDYELEGTKPCGFQIEIADLVIRAADLAGVIGFDLQHAIELKLEYNKIRPYKHGRKI